MSYCNRTGHCASNCRYKDAICNHCKLKGHLCTACPKKKNGTLSRDKNSAFRSCERFVNQLKAMDLIEVND